MKKNNTNSFPHFTKTHSLVLFFVSFLFLFTSCYNPFAPEESGLSSDLWDSQETVGGLLRNFQTSYTMKDSLRYSDLIARDFEFYYYNTEYSSYDNWGRDTELRATGGMMRNTLRLDLLWGPISSELDTFSQVDTTVEFSINFTLSTDLSNAISGNAVFKMRASEDGKFRINEWRDDY